MAITSGTRLGPYEIQSALGAGGMGEVWRARDTKLDRDVAIKVLPEAFVHDADRLARFQREAKTLASLNHPNIATIYGIEERGGTHALVMELVDGDDLSQQITRGAIPIDEALPIAKQIAEALEAAHEHGIVHRDLKPANIKVRADGTVKVLDFGLAKAMEPASAHGASAGQALSQSPTITTPAMTQMGVILGTAAYMSPEQARGKPADKRADIWAFGCVLYEMLSGTRVFGGEDVSDTLANVLKMEPALEGLPPAVPPRVRLVIRGCLQKSPKQRIGDAQDIRLALEGAFETVVRALSGPDGGPPLHPWQKPVPLMLIGVALLVTGVLAGWATIHPAPAPTGLVQFTIVPPETAPLNLGNSFGNLLISPDGTKIIYTNAPTDDGPRQLNLRPIDQLVWVPLRGTEGAAGPFMSSDGQWVGFFDNRTARLLQKVSILGGPPVKVTESPALIRGATWGTDDQIIFGTGSTGLFRVPGGGGEPEPLTTLGAGEGEMSHRWPFIIPDREAVVFVIRSGSDDQVAVLDLRTGTVTRLGLAGTSPRYVSTGHLVFAAADASVRAVAFDARSLTVTGSPVPLLDGVSVKESGAADVGISDNGRLVYALGLATSARRLLAFVDRNGRSNPLNAPPDQYLSPRLSPDESRLAVQTTSERGDVIWTYALSDDRQIRQLTFEGDNRRPIWTPDGERITFASDRDGTMSLYWQPADGSSPAERLTTAAEGEMHWPGSWSPDGRVLAFMVQRPNEQDWDIWTLSRLGSTWKTEPLFDVEGGVHMSPEFSPNGRWLAYAAGDAISSQDVYVEPFPRTGQVDRISRDGGYWPFWSKNGDRLFYRAISTTFGNRLRSVEIDTQPDFRFSNESALPPEGFNVVTYYRDYDVTADGERFLMVFPTESEQQQPEIIVVLNWFGELKARVPVP